MRPSPLLTAPTDRRHPPPSSQPSQSRRRSAFTLAEMLVVMAVIVIVLASSGPAITALKGSNDMNKAASDIASMIQICRSYAIANNTYVYLGFGEFDANKPESGPQTPASGNVGGRVAMVAIASKDGTRHYSPYASNLTEVKNYWVDATTGYRNGTDFVVVVKLQRYANMHVFSYFSSGTISPQPPTTGGMARPTVPLIYHMLGDPQSDTMTPITYPLGTASPDYIFKKVLQFDPDGLVRTAPSGAPTAAADQNQVPYSPQGVPDWMEFGFIQTHGNAVPAAEISRIQSAPDKQNTGNHVCVVIDGIKGSVRTFRPK